MKRYIIVYYHLFTFLLKSNISYRFNFFLRLFYGPSYVGVLFSILWLAYENVSMLGGFTKNEAILLFSIFNLLYIGAYSVYLQGIRHFLWSGIRNGELDLLLTKPMPVQFLFSFSRPNYEQFVVMIAMLGLLFRQVWILQAHISVGSFLLFVLVFCLGILIHYLLISSYAVSGFYFVKAAQVIEMLDKASDFASYPTSLFPSSIQLLAFSVLPIAFLGYVPFLFLIQKGNLYLFAYTIILAIILFFVNRFLWTIGLKKYSSASS